MYLIDPQAIRISSQQPLNNIVVFASGSGTNFQAIIDACRNGDLPAQIVGLITDKEDAGAIDRASKVDIPVRCIRPAHYNDINDYCMDLLTQLREWSTDVITLAGYLKKIPSCVISEYPDRILNIHPSLLPKFGGKGFYGMRVHEAVIEANETESGCTVHIVTEEFDQGPILGQITVPVHKDDSPARLAKRILEKEHQLYPEVIRNHLKTLNNRGFTTSGRTSKA